MKQSELNSGFLNFSKVLLTRPVSRCFRPLVKAIGDDDDDCADSGVGGGDNDDDYYYDDYMMLMILRMMMILIVWLV